MLKLVLILVTLSLGACKTSPMPQPAVEAAVIEGETSVETFKSDAEGETSAVSDSADASDVALTAGKMDAGAADTSAEHKKDVGFNPAQCKQPAPKK